MSDKKILLFPQKAPLSLKEKTQPLQKKTRLNFWKKWALKRLKKKQTEKSLLLEKHYSDSKD